MSTVEDVDLSIRYVCQIAFRLAGIERKLIFAPYHQQPRLLLAHPRLPLRVVLYIGSIVIEQIALNLGLAGLTNKTEFIHPEIGVVAFYVRVVADMSSTCRRER